MVLAYIERNRRPVFATMAPYITLVKGSRVLTASNLVELGMLPGAAGRVRLLLRLRSWRRWGLWSGRRRHLGYGHGVAVWLPWDSQCVQWSRSRKGLVRRTKPEGRKWGNCCWLEVSSCQDQSRDTPGYSCLDMGGSDGGVGRRSVSVIVLGERNNRRVGSSR